MQFDTDAVSIAMAGCDRQVVMMVSAGACRQRCVESDLSQACLSANGISRVDEDVEVGHRSQLRHWVQEVSERRALEHKMFDGGGIERIGDLDQYLCAHAVRVAVAHGERREL
jgi:hypothetical protein